MANPWQLGFFDEIHPTNASITIREDHELLLLAKMIPWSEAIEVAMSIRASKVKAMSGPEPHYRELLGAVALMSARNITYRQAEDLIAHYAPARYLCDLMDSSWQPDHITIFDFTQMLGPERMDLLNRKFLSQAEEIGILDPSRLMSDTTAQEAMIPYPNEVGLMKRFGELVSKNLKKVGGKFSSVKGKIKQVVSKIKGLARRSHLFAKTKEEKVKIGKKLLRSVEGLHDLLKASLEKGNKVRSKSAVELERLFCLMDRLLPQIRHFLETGFVAAGEIIHLQMPDLYAIVRGKAGKSVEFSLKWGINQVDGFVLGFLLNTGVHVSDQKYCLQAIKEYIELFDEAPKTFGFDRGGYSKSNIKKAKKLEVKNVGIAPTGKAKREVSDRMAEAIRRERAQVEGLIGNVKSKKYGFNKPNVRSTRAMETSAHRSFLDFNLTKAVRKLSLMQEQMA